MNEIDVTAVGADRPGIVAAITGALLELGGNLEETRAALLRGSFATVLAVAVPDGVGREEVQAALRPVALELGLGLWVGEAAPRSEAPPLARAVVSVYGADHPGIVHAMATARSRGGASDRGAASPTHSPRPSSRATGRRAACSSSRPTPSGTATARAVANEPRRRAARVSSRFPPSSSSAPVIAATIPGRSAPTAVTTYSRTPEV